MEKHLLEAAAADRPAFIAAATYLVAVIAREHDFTLNALSVAEANRLLGFIETLDRDRYPDFAGWSNVLFVTAQSCARLDVEGKLRAAREAVPRIRP